MHDQKFVATYRVKNEERFLKKSIESIYDLCDEIVILDDGSTDHTAEIYSNFDKVVDIHKQFNLPLDEVRDRNYLLQMVLKRKPDIIISIDGDEIFMPHAKDILLEELNVLYPNENLFEFQFLTLWNNYDQLRFDGIFGNYYQKRLFRTKNQTPELKFENTSISGNLHGGSIPSNLTGFEKPLRSKVKIFHLASIDEKLRQQKFQFYTNLDPNNPITDGYRHMISGEGKFSGLNGIEIKKLPKEFTINL